MQSVITLDGPSGVGKSTIARLFAKRINYTYLDTGLIYRAITYHIIQEKTLLKDKEKIQEALRKVRIDVKKESVYLNGEDITDKVKTKQITENVPLYAQNEDIRDFTRRIQLKIGEKGNCIVDGRDVGTVVFPKAFCKFYLDATPKIRTQRRHKDLRETEPKTTFEEVEKAIRKRDHEDTHRKKSPLKIPLDALIIDTSDKTIEEVIEVMSEHYNKQISYEMHKNSNSDYQEFVNAMDKISTSPLKQEDIQKAKIIHIGNKIILDIGAKKDAIISEQETSHLDASSLKVGEEVSVLIKANQPNEEHIRVSLLAIQVREGLEDIRKAFENNLSIKGVITNEVRGGVLVDIKTIKCFCPYSELDLYKINKRSLLEKEETFEVITFDKGKVILSRKKLLEKKYRQVKEEYFNNTKVGDIRHAKVIKIMHYGALMELQEGVTGLLRMRNITWERFEDINTLMKVGDIFPVQILEINDNQTKIEVSKKHAEEDPIESFAKQHKVEDIIEGTVKTIKPYGAFVKVGYGVEGLLHISDMSWTKKINNPNEILKEGNTVKVSILVLDVQERRVALGLKQLNENPWANIESRFSLDEMINITVKSHTPKGIYCTLSDGFEGFIHRDDFSWKNEKIDIKKEFPIGSKADVKVIGYEKTKKLLKLGFKQKSTNPWKDLEANYGLRASIKAKITKLIDSGCLVRVNEDIEGFCHLSQLGEKDYETVEDAVKVGEEHDFIIQKIDEDKQQVHLSIKAFLKKKSKDEVQKYMGNKEKSKITIRDFLQ